MAVVGLQQGVIHSVRASQSWMLPLVQSIPRLKKVKARTRAKRGGTHQQASSLSVSRRSSPGHVHPITSKRVESFMPPFFFVLFCFCRPCPCSRRPNPHVIVETMSDTSHIQTLSDPSTYSNTSDTSHSPTHQGTCSVFNVLLPRQRSSTQQCSLFNKHT